MSVERVLLTNDDGIDAVGLRALYDGLSADYDVVTVAPTGDRSSAGRALSDGVDIADHELGYAVDGTPVDCVVAGLDALVPDADVVVAGCNKGANLGAYTLGRSGTVSAAVEAAFFDVPAVATSMYVPGGKTGGSGSWSRRSSRTRPARPGTSSRRRPRRGRSTAPTTSTLTPRSRIRTESATPQRRCASPRPRHGTGWRRHTTETVA